MATVYYEDYIADDTEKYDESQDEDFDPDDAPQGDEESSSSDEDNAPAKSTSRSTKRKVPVDDELDSGDEVTIQAARRKKSKKQKKGKKGDDDEDLLSEAEGEGGLIKTRAQRRVEQVERKPLARTEGATVDVDALWAQMTAAPLKPLQPTKPLDTSIPDAPAPAPKPVPIEEEEEQIQIKKTYTFAGQDTTEEKSIPRSHLDKYTSDGWTLTAPSKPTDTSPDAKHKANTSKIRRPLRRPSRFDANPTGYVRTLAPEHQLTYPRATTTITTTMPPPSEIPVKAKEKAIQKLNVVDKSRMDWTGFVDKEGIAEELDTHGKTKEAYLGRMEFLKEVEARREEERKKVRVAGMAAGAAVV